MYCITIILTNSQFIGHRARKMCLNYWEMTLWDGKEWHTARGSMLISSTQIAKVENEYGLTELPLSLLRLSDDQNKICSVCTMGMMEQKCKTDGLQIEPLRIKAKMFSSTGTHSIS